MKKYEILFVEDDSSIEFLVSRYKFWKEEEFSIKANARNGKVALAYLEKNDIDIVIIDIRMPVMDGMELLRKIRERQYDLGVILASNYCDFSYAKEGIRLGAIDYIEKPYSEEKMYAALRLAKKSLSEKDKTIDYVKRLSEKYQLQSMDNTTQRIITFIQEHLEEEHMLDFLSEYIGLSKDYLGKTFKTKVGITITEYCTNARMEKAKDMLRGTNKKVYEISQDLGYTTVDYFSKLFKNYTGVTPAQYKK